MEPWSVLDEKERSRWTFTPLRGAGPLRFGMTHEQAEAAAAGVLRTAFTRGAPGHETRADFDLDHRPDTRFAGPAVTAYYDRSTGLAAIAVNALRGPQVTLDGTRLVGQVPSHLEKEFLDHLDKHGKEARYSQTADLCSTQLGLVLRVQRAGDHVLSRPVMVAEAWAERCWDVSEGHVPEEEWKTFEW